MNYFDSDSTNTDWTESGMQGDSGRYPSEDVFGIPGYSAAGHCDEVAADDPAWRGEYSNLKLQEMFARFLYGK
jgi:hypothetical protein